MSYTVVLFTYPTFVGAHRKNSGMSFWGLRVTYAVYIRLIGKVVGDFLLVIIELFTRCFRFITNDVCDGHLYHRKDRVA